jgi:hypothetical protein
MNLLRRVLMRAEAPLALSVSVDDVADAFYEQFATLDSGRYWWWIQMMLLEPNELIVNDGYDELYRMAFEVSDNGPGNEPSVTFGELTRVRLEPVDSTMADDDDQVPVAARSEAVLAACQGIASVRGPERVMASFQSREESRPEAKQEEVRQVNEYIKRLRAKLGLSADVPDDQVLAAAATALEAEEGPGNNEEGSSPSPQAPNADGTTPDPAESTPDPEPEEAGDGGSTALRVAPESLAELREQARMGAEARVQQLRSEDEAFVDEAIRVGRIPPRARASYLARMSRSPEARTEERAFIESLDENVIPVTMRGGAGEGETTTSTTGDGAHPQYEQYLAAHLPDVAERRKSLLAGAEKRSRVHTDA